MSGGVVLADGVVASSGISIADVTSIATSIANSVIDSMLESGIGPSAITVGGSPFTYQNPLNRPVSVMVSGGTVTTISISRDGTNFFLVGLLAGMFHLSAGDYLRVVYILAPTMTLIPF